MLAFSRRKNTKGGGSVQQPLAYLDTAYSNPSAPAGKDLLIEHGGIARPMIGGFSPTIYGGVQSAGILAPLAAIAARRLWNSRTQTRKGGGKRENWARNREAAKEMLLQYGSPSFINVNQYAALLRKSPEAARAFLELYRLKKANKGTRKVRKPNVAVAPVVAAAEPTRVAAPSPGPGPGAVARHVFLNTTGKIVAEENVIPGQALRLTVNATGRIVRKANTFKKPRVEFKKSVTFKNTQPRIQTGVLSSAVPTLNAFVNTTKAPSKPVVKTPYKSKNKKITTLLSSIGATSAAPEEIKPKTKDTRKVTNAWKTFYAQAKANLAATGKKAKPWNVKKLTTIREEGKNNAAFMSAFKNRLPK